MYINGNVHNTVLCGCVPNQIGSKLQMLYYLAEIRLPTIWITINYNYVYYCNLPGAFVLDKGQNKQNVRMFCAVIMQ